MHQDGTTAFWGMVPGWHYAVFNRGATPRSFWVTGIASDEI